MAQVMLAEQEPPLPVEARRRGAQPRGEPPLLEDLVADPNRRGLAERAEAPRGERQIGCKEARELQIRLVIKGDVIDGVEIDARFLEAIGDGVRRVAAVVFAAGETATIRPSSTKAAALS
jgi:hypothetical protein